MSTTQSEFKDFALTEFPPGEDPNGLKDDTPLITGGILDSLATIKLVAYLEETYKIEFSPHETGVDYLNTIADITALVESKRRAGS